MRSANVFAKGLKAFGFCDRCGFRYNLSELKEQYINLQASGLMVCKSCMDIDHEQLRTEQLPGADAIALARPRPDNGLTESRNFWGWNPIRGLPITLHVGRVTVTTTD